MSATIQPPVLLLDSDAQRRIRVAAALRARGFVVSTATNIAEIERWPVGQIVVVDATCFTPLWTAIGAAHVVVLSETVEAARAPSDAPCTRIAAETAPEALISVLEALTDPEGRRSTWCPAYDGTPSSPTRATST